MTLQNQNIPAGGRPPQTGLLIGIIVAGAIATAVVILTVLRDVPLPARVLLVAADLLVSALACWAISRAAKR
jgi:hypothetical protein